MKNFVKDLYNKRCQHVPITINDKVIPHSNTWKYLRMTLDAKLRWKVHVKKKTRRAWAKIQENILAHGKKIKVEIITNEIGKFATKHEERLLHHVNIEVIQLLDKSELMRRLKRQKLSS